MLEPEAYRTGMLAIAQFVKELDEEPQYKATSLGVELAPKNEPDRVASVELNISGLLLLTLPLGSRSTAPPPPMFPPGEV